jgi:capsular polysaccharide biosynthesis protein
VELRQYLGLLRRRWAAVLGLVAVAVAVAAVTTVSSHRHAASTVIYVGATEFSAAGGEAATADPTLLAERLLGTYAALLESRSVISEAIEMTGVDRSVGDVLGATEVTPGTDTQLLTVTVTDSDPVVAQALANAVSDEFISRVAQLGDQPGPGSLPSLPAYIFQRAEVPDDSIAGRLGRNVVLAGLFGLLVAAGLVLLLEQLDVTLKDKAEAEARLELPVLGAIPHDPGLAAGVRKPVANVQLCQPSQSQERANG